MNAHNELQQPLTDREQEVIKKEVKDQFSRLVSAINEVNSFAWSEHYSNNEFISAIVGTDYLSSRNEWVEIITTYFSKRKSQLVEPVEVQVTALSAYLALMTSEEKSAIELKNGQHMKAKHVYTMIWKKELDGWKILHSHESWKDEL